MTTAKPTPIRVALDWTPNTVHSGLFVANSALHNLYGSANLSVTLILPDPSYTTTPAKLVETGQADLCICPSESCVAYAEAGRRTVETGGQNGQTKMQLCAIYAILARDASAIVSRTCLRPRDLVDSSGGYGSYNARYEDDIVRAMVEHDGGDASKLKVRNETGKLDLFEEVLHSRMDATWVFLPWEGLEAEMAGHGVRAWRLEGYGVPYGYAPVIAYDSRNGKVGEAALRRFVAATTEGYKIAMRKPEEAARCLEKECRPKRERDFLEESQRMINAYYADGDKLGRMKDEKWEEWVSWLRNRDLLKDQSVNYRNLYTNNFFE